MVKFPNFRVPFYFVFHFTSPSRRKQQQSETQGRSPNLTLAEPNAALSSAAVTVVENEKIIFSRWTLVQRSKKAKSNEANITLVRSANII